MSAQTVRRLSLQEKIGQILMPRLDFSESNVFSYARKLVSDYRIGSFIVMGGEFQDVKLTIEELQNISEPPLFFGCDAERGVGQILNGATLFPFTMTLGATADTELVYREARFIANEMKGCGLNLNFAPVVDVNTNPENPIINIRSYGDDTEIVSKLGNAFIGGCQDVGIMACAKHFPGHGSTENDSHINMPILNRPANDFLKSDLIPFKEAIKCSVSSIMVAHIAVPWIERRGIPSTISEEVIHRLLIRDLGFNGLIISDSFHMGSIERIGAEEEVACMAIDSGCDIICDPRDPFKIMEGLSKMVATGKFSLKHLDRAVEKIATAKQRWVAKNEVSKIEGERSKHDLLHEIASRSVCLLKGGKLASREAKIYVLDITQSEKDISKPFFDSLLKSGIKCYKEEILPLGNKVSLQLKAGSNQCLICLVYSSVGAWKECYKLTEFYDLFLKRVAKIQGEKILISFGSPYIVQEFGDFNTIICIFDQMDVCQMAAAKVLLGQLEPRGSMPVKL